MKAMLSAPRRVVYGLLFAAVITLSTIGPWQSSSNAKAVLDQIVYLPLISRGVPANTIPQP